jgi:hypothetical protein
VTAVVPIGKLLPDVAVLVRVGVEQLSEAVGATQVAMAVVPVVVRLILLGQLAMTGATISLAHWLNCWTIILNEQVAVLPATSRAV